MRILLFLTLCIPFVSNAQTPLQTSSKVIVDDGYDYTELSSTPWGGSHGIFFGSKVNYTGTNDLWSSGNAVYAQSPGSYNYGAFSMGYIANGGQFSFYAGGLSTGAGNQITWKPVMTMVRGGNVGIGTLYPEVRFQVEGESRFNGAGWFSRYNNGYSSIALSLGQNKDWDMPAVQILTSDNNGANNASWLSTRYVHQLNFQRQSPSGIKNIVTLGGAEGGNHYLSIYSTDGATEKIKFVSDGTSYIQGNVGIGTTDPGTYKLAVEGTIGARKVKVITQAWADYVFEPTYQLPTLQEVATYIEANKHLPDVPFNFRG